MKSTTEQTFESVTEGFPNTLTRSWTVLVENLGAPPNSARAFYAGATAALVLMLRAGRLAPIAQADAVARLIEELSECTDALCGAHREH